MAMDSSSVAKSVLPSFLLGLDPRGLQRVYCLFIITGVYVAQPDEFRGVEHDVFTEASVVRRALQAASHVHGTILKSKEAQYGRDNRPQYPADVFPASQAAVSHRCTDGRHPLFGLCDRLYDRFFHTEKLGDISERRFDTQHIRELSKRRFRR